MRWLRAFIYGCISAQFLNTGFGLTLTMPIFWFWTFLILILFALIDYALIDPWVVKLKKKRKNRKTRYE